MELPQPDLVPKACPDLGRGHGCNHGGFGAAGQSERRPRALDEWPLSVELTSINISSQLRTARCLPEPEILGYCAKPSNDMLAF